MAPPDLTSESQALPMAEQEGIFAGQKLRAFAPYRIGDWPSLFKHLTVLRRGGNEDEPTIIVRAAPAVSNAVRIVLSAKTGLTLVEHSLPMVKGLGVIPTRTLYEDYREVDGVKIPFRAVSEGPLIGKITVQFREVKTNLDLNDDAFNVRASATAPAD